MAYGYSVKARDMHGLDPDIYVVNIGVHRADGEALTDDEIRAIRAALAEAAAALPPAPAATASGGSTPSTPTGTGGV